MARLLRATLIRVAWEHPSLRPTLLPLLREARTYEARTYEEYTKDKEQRGETPKPKAEWEAWGKGEQHLKSKGVDVEKLRARMPKEFTDKMFDELVTSAKKLPESKVKRFVEMTKAEDMDAGEIVEWAQSAELSDSVKSWVDEQVKAAERDDEDSPSALEALGNFSLGLLSWFSDLVDKGKTG